MRVADLKEAPLCERGCIVAYHLRTIEHGGPSEISDFVTTEYAFCNGGEYGDRDAFYHWLFTAQDRSSVTELTYWMCYACHLMNSMYLIEELPV